MLQTGLRRALSGGIALAAVAGMWAQNRVDFGREVQPIFAQSCQGCHGGKAQLGQLRLDAKQAALMALNGQVMQQAAMLSFNDAWLFILIAFIGVSPAILLLRKPKVMTAAVDAH